MIVLSESVTVEAPGKPWNRVSLCVDSRRRIGSRRVPIPGDRTADGRQTYCLEGFTFWEMYATASCWRDRGHGYATLDSSWPRAHCDPVEFEGEEPDPAEFLAAVKDSLLAVIEELSLTWEPKASPCRDASEAFVRAVAAMRGDEIDL